MIRLRGPVKGEERWLHFQCGQCVLCGVIPYPGREGEVQVISMTAEGGKRGVGRRGGRSRGKEVEEK